MKIDPKTNETGTVLQEMSADEIEAVGGGSFKLANPGPVNPNYFNRPSGPLLGGYVYAW